jgi:predicted NBD/HSP70 family sugar kinase
MGLLAERLRPGRLVDRRVLRRSPQVVLVKQRTELNSRQAVECERLDVAVAHLAQRLRTLAGCVNFFNPGVIVIGGDVGQAPEMLAGVREVTIQRSLPLATGELSIVPSQLGDRAGVVGAAIMVI